MTPDRWQEVKKLIERQFEITDTATEDLNPGSADIVEFISPLGKLQARFIKTPKVLEKKTSYSKRIGSDVSVNYVYSDSEQVSHLEIFKWDDLSDSWKPFSASGLF